MILKLMLKTFCSSVLLFPFISLPSSQPTSLWCGSSPSSCVSFAKNLHNQAKEEARRRGRMCTLTHKFCLWVMAVRWWSFAREVCRVGPPHWDVWMNSFHNSQQHSPSSLDHLSGEIETRDLPSFCFSSLSPTSKNSLCLSSSKDRHHFLYMKY